MNINPKQPKYSLYLPALQSGMIKLLSAFLMCAINIWRIIFLNAFLFSEPDYICGMPDNTLSPMRLKTIFTLHFEGRGTKYISMITGISRLTVQKMIQKLRELNHLKETDIMNMDHGKLMKLFNWECAVQKTPRCFSSVTSEPRIFIFIIHAVFQPFF